MALTDFSIYSDFVYSSLTETITQEIDKFNAASRGAIVLRAAANMGDYADNIKYKIVTGGLVRRRNAYSNAAVAPKTLQHLVETSVKVAAGTPAVEINPVDYSWIQKNPEEAGVVLGTQLASEMIADMLNTAISAGYAAMIQNANIAYNATGDVPDTLGPVALNKAAAKMGDRSSNIVAWVTHSTPMHNYWNNNMTTYSNLFTYGSIAVREDPFGRIFIVTDSPALIDVVPTPDTYHVLGLVPGALVVEQNNDFLLNIAYANGNENIARTWQAEWTFNLGVKGYSWDKANGGKSPTDAAIAVSTNWDKNTSSDKNGPGVILKVDFA